MLDYDRSTGAWTIAGEARAEPLSETREKIVSALERAHPLPMTGKAIATATGLAEGTVRQRLMLLEQAGKIHRVARGLYASVTPPPLTPRNNHNSRNNEVAEPANGMSDCYDRRGVVTISDDQNRRNGAESPEIVTAVTGVTAHDAFVVEDEQLVFFQELSGQADPGRWTR